MTRATFFQLIENKFRLEDCKNIHVAYWLAKAIHRNQMRDSGERYFEHCRRVATTIAERDDVSADEVTIALLHDCVEDGFVPRDVIKALFGNYVDSAINVLSKKHPVFDEITTAIKDKNRKEDSYYYRGICEVDRRVRLIKFADRLDNLRSMGCWPEERRKKYISETEKFILPMARETDEQFYQQLKEALDG